MTKSQMKLTPAAIKYRITDNTEFGELGTADLEGFDTSRIDARAASIPKPITGVGNVGVEILQDPFHGIVFHYGIVTPIEDPNGFGLKFDYKIDVGSQDLEQDEDFKEVAASILYDIITGTNNAN